MIRPLTAEQCSSISLFPSLSTVLAPYGLPAEPSLAPLQFSSLTHLTLGSHASLSAATMCSLTQLTFLLLFALTTEVNQDPILPGSLTRLQRLHSLEVREYNISSELTKLESLRNLRIQARAGATYDLSGFLQLTNLCISLIGCQEDVSSLFILPAGDQVQLQHLTASTRGRLRNLQFATALVYLEVDPWQVEHTSWPYHMPWLRSLTVADHLADAYFGSSLYKEEEDTYLIDPLPAAWQHYRNLEYLRIPFYCTQDGMPAWLPTLQHLTELDLPRAESHEFLTDLLQLSQLHRLNLSHARMPWDEEVVEFAKWPNLQYLNLGWTGWFDKEQNKPHDYNCDKERLNLRKLEHALGARPMKLSKMVVLSPDGEPLPDLLWTFLPSDYGHMHSCVVTL